MLQWKQLNVEALHELNFVNLLLALTQLSVTIVPDIRCIFEAGIYEFKCNCSKRDAVETYGSIGMVIAANGRVIFRSQSSSITLKVDGQNSQPVIYTILCALLTPTEYGELQKQEVVVYGKVLIYLHRCR